MSGLIEQIAADVAAIKAMLSAGAGAVQQPQQQFVQQQPQVQPQVQQFVQQQPQVQPQVQQTQYPAVNAEQVTALITPHVADPNLKAALQQQMAAMGIPSLPDAQPHQYGELYARFQQVIAQFTAQGQQQQSNVPASII